MQPLSRFVIKIFTPLFAFYNQDIQKPRDSSTNESEMIKITTFRVLIKNTRLSWNYVASKLLAPT